MSQESSVFIASSIGINVLFFLMGYAWCKIHIRETSEENTPTSTNTGKRSGNKKNNMQLVDIDSTKVVVDLKTDHLEKKYENLGEVKKSEEKITDSVNKLKNMKR